MVRPIDVVVDPSFDNTTFNGLPSITLMKIQVLKEIASNFDMFRITSLTADERTKSWSTVSPL
jgi:hypothetical protein